MDTLDKSFKPTVGWMKEKYDEMNAKLFDGKLMGCDFEVFTTGKGMEGRTLGWFCIKGKNLRVKRHGRRMFLLGWPQDIYVSKENFVTICKPEIKLNGNYTGTEHAFLTTLVHEMCHYYTYMNGYSPAQAHGREFKSIAQYISSRSNGMFTIQRLASSEQMAELELSDEMKAKRAKRLANKKASVSAIFDYRTNGEIHLTITSNTGLIQTILSYHDKKGTYKMVKSNDANLIELLFSKGFRKNMRSWRYWNVEDKDWISMIDEFNITEYFNPEYKQKPKDGEVKLGIKRQVAQQASPKQPSTQPKLMFSIRTSTGVFETECSSYMELRNKLQQRFPNMSYETISKLMNNNANFKKIEENKMNTKSIIKEVIEEFMNNDMGDDSVAITPDMNLGLHSPNEDEV